jgi:hypothetical protein
MALVLKDRVKETSTTAGTGTLTLAGAVAGYQSFSVIGDANTTYYTIVDPTANTWEVGIGTYTSSGTTLSRDTILESSSGGSAVSFASNAKDVFVTYPAERAVATDLTQTLTNKTLSGALLYDGYTEEVFAVSGTTPALSPTNGTVQTWTLTGSSTPTAGTWAEGQSITLMVDDGSAFSITWSSVAVTWKTNGGVAPTLNTTGYTGITLWKVGTTIFGARIGDA